ncbi:MAG: hypothetical protein AAFR32_07425 [Pseudomonadota bacterium]
MPERQEVPIPPIEVFRAHIADRGYAFDDASWRSIAADLVEVEAKRGTVLLDSAQVTRHLYFVSRGIAATFQTSVSGDVQIARFFERGQLASNITSAWQQSVSADELVAMSDFAGVMVPFDQFRESFLKGGALAEYWREMVLDTLLFDKDLMCAKTFRDVGSRYRFLTERYEEVVEQVPDKHLARFLGITPQGLSRFRKNHLES